MMWFTKKEWQEWVDLSIGRVYIRPLTNGIINSVTAKSTIYGSVLNNAMYFGLMEYELAVLKPKQIDNLSVQDGNKLREKVKEILARHGLIKVEFTQNEIDTFKEQEKDLMNRLRLKNATSSQSHN